jgi:glycosyltransferase involved in cell wall biosynthesis
MPSVTVLIPAYNAGRTLGRALQSVWRQDWPDLEVIVVDDASTDDTREVASYHSRSRLRIITLDRNRGECGAMNEGIAAASGELIAFLDADDEWLEGKLAKQITIMARDPELVFTSCRCAIISPSGAARTFGAGPELSGNEAWRFLLRRPQIGKPCVVTRRSALLAAGGFDECLKVAGDQDMWIRLSLQGPVVFLPDILVRVYDTPNSLMARYAEKEIEFAMGMVERHVALLGDRLTKAERRRIRAERLTQYGRKFYGSGRLYEGARLLLRAMWLGDARAENLWYIITASPPAQRVKRRLGIGTVTLVGS